MYWRMPLSSSLSFARLSVDRPLVLRRTEIASTSAPVRRLAHLHGELLVASVVGDPTLDHCVDTGGLRCPSPRGGRAGRLGLRLRAGIFPALLFRDDVVLLARGAGRLRLRPASARAARAVEVEDDEAAGLASRWRRRKRGNLCSGEGRNGRRWVSDMAGLLSVVRERDAFRWW